MTEWLPMKKLTAGLTRLGEVAASLWIGLVLTASLHANEPLNDPGAIWLGTSAAIWFLVTRRSPPTEA